MKKYNEEKGIEILKGIVLKEKSTSIVAIIENNCIFAIKRRNYAGING